MHHISKELEFLKRRLFPVLLAAALLPIPGTAAAATATTTKTTAPAKSTTIEGFTARVPIHVMSAETSSPKGLTPDQIKDAYRLPKSGGTGTVAIVTAYHSPTIESDLSTFSTQFNIPTCTAANSCLEVHQMSSKMKQSSGWGMETALDTEWAHAIAPTAKILVVEAASALGPDLIKAVDYARSRSDVTSVSMSWGGKEYKNEIGMDNHFTSDHNIAFFAASGDNGYGVSWPATSPNVTAVGGTTLTFNADGSYEAEKAWSGSGGGVSAYEIEPGFQKSYSIPKANGKRAIPDVAFNADPKSGYSVYHQTETSSADKKGWYVVGGTSAGAPQWAAIKSLDNVNGPATSAASSSVAYDTQLYEDKASANHSQFFRDITSGSNGDCGYYCDARKHYDYVTGLGTPIAHKF